MPLEQVEKDTYDRFVTNLSIRRGSLEKVTMPAQPNVQYLKNYQDQLVAKRIVGDDGTVEFWINKAYKYGQPVPPPDPIPGKIPTLSSITPDNAALGDPDITLEVNGTNFTDTTLIVFNGGEEATSYVSPTLITTIVKPSTASVAGSYPVLVRQGSFDTASLPFTFTEPVIPAEMPEQQPSEPSEV